MKTNNPEAALVAGLENIRRQVAGHTPEPWNVSKHATPAHSPQFGIYAGDSGRDLATVKGKNAEADAALIAAAPDLKEMTQWFLDACESGELKPRDSDAASLRFFNERVAFAREAIARAEGRP